MILPIAVIKIQNTTEETCKGLTFANDKLSFKNSGMIYCKEPMKPKINPVINKHNDKIKNGIDSLLRYSSI